MKNNKKNSSQNRTDDFYTEAEKQGNKRKSKNKDVSRFINEGNPNTQAVNKNEKENEEQGFQNPDQQADPS